MPQLSGSIPSAGYCYKELHNNSTDFILSGRLDDCTKLMISSIFS